jgi:hypothetical protein
MVDYFHIKTYTRPHGWPHISAPSTKSIVYPISKKWRRSLLDVCSYRRADVASDHHLVMAQLRLKLEVNKTSGQWVIWKKFNIEKFNHRGTRKKFEEKLIKSLHQERVNELNPSEHWTTIKEAMLAKSESILGLSQRKHLKDWVTEETWNEIKVCKKNQAENEQCRL